MPRTQLIVPSRVAIFSFLVSLLVGTILLSLPYVFIDRRLTLFEGFFTAVSSLAVTGLEVVPFHQFTALGQFILLILVQLGGLGLTTLTLIVIASFVDMGLGTQSMASELFEMPHVRDVKRILFFIAGLTLSCELLAVPFLFWSLSHYYPTLLALRLSVLHAVSSFCNAGLDIFPGGSGQFSHDLMFLIPTAALIFIGGTGFLAWYNLFGRLLAKLRGKPTIRLTLYTKICLWVSLWLIIFGACAFWFIESENSLRGMPLWLQLVNSLFNGITMRSAGFLTVATQDLHAASVFLIMVLSFIGSAPGSTGSGIKVAAFALMGGIIRAVIRNEPSVHLFSCAIYKTQLYKAMAIIFLSLLCVIVGLFVLLLTNPEWSVGLLALEAFSAFTNLGLSAGITGTLSTLGQMILALEMIVGRVGILTAITAIAYTQRRREYEYPEEHVLLS